MAAQLQSAAKVCASCSPITSRNLALFKGVKAGERRPNSVMLEIGSTVEGTVVKLADYGAIVRLAGGKMGLVHISEIADTYVRDVRDYFKENDRICVKVIKVNDKGRYELSAKQADSSAVQKIESRPVQRKDSSITVGYEHDRRREVVPATFEDRLSRFMKDSEERQLDIKRNIESKRGGRRK
ncbi:MAG TPA: S1 RNA-binding domain-containing protein [Armatimonadota bacterium]|nr:S1 RNA-binding domain-containing protein [Armatimonadota bacterium]